METLSVFQLEYTGVQAIVGIEEADARLVLVAGRSSPVDPADDFSDNGLEHRVAS